MYAIIRIYIYTHIIRIYIYTYVHFAVCQMERWNVDQLYWHFERVFFLVALNQFCAMVTPFELLVAWFVSDVVLFFVPVPAVVIAGVAKASLVSSMLSSSLPCLWSHLASPLSLSFSLFSCTRRDCSTCTYTCRNARSIRSLVVLVIVIVLDRWGWHGDGVGLMRAKPHS